jgi:putative phosphoesterase
MVRAGLVAALDGCDLIVHAGDVGNRKVLRMLEAVAPVVAVQGNMDKDLWARQLRPTEVVEVGDILLYVLHDLDRLDLDPAAAGLAAVISGHTHRPAIRRCNGVLFVNPGSAGPRRYQIPASVALLEIEDQALNARLVTLPG